MKKYECPYCHENTISPLTKAFLGTPSSKGKKCPKCGGRVVNNMKSTLFSLIFSGVCLAGMIYLYFSGLDWAYFVILIWVSLIVPKIVNAFCFGLAKTQRIDVN